MHAHVLPFTGSGMQRDMELLRTVPYLQGSDAGQKHFKI